MQGFLEIVITPRDEVAARTLCDVFRQICQRKSECSVLHHASRKPCITFREREGLSLGRIKEVGKRTIDENNDGIYRRKLFERLPELGLTQLENEPAKGKPGGGCLCG